MAKSMCKPVVTVVASVIAITLSLAPASEAIAKDPSQSNGNDWPQWRGPNRDGVAPSSPKLLDTWPKDGPPLLWKSETLPQQSEGGCGSPVVADGKVFLYLNEKKPVGGGYEFHLITTELLTDWGWLPDLPENLAKRVEDVWASPNRPSSRGWQWWNVEWSKKPNGIYYHFADWTIKTQDPSKELDEFLAKKPELDKYIKDFIATLTPQEAKQYGTYIKRRFCMDVTGDLRTQGPQALTWAQLTKLSKLRGVGHKILSTDRGVGYQTLYSCPPKVWSEDLKNAGLDPKAVLFNVRGTPIAWARSFVMSDTVVCFDAATGKTIWKKDFPEDPEIYLSDYSGSLIFGGLGCCTTPAIWNGKCYVGGAMGVYGLSAKDGALLWQARQEPSHNAVLVADGVVYHNGRAYNAETGQLLWKSEQFKLAAEYGHFMWDTILWPVLWTSGEKKYVITANGNSWGHGKTLCLDLKTGAPLWTLNSKPGGVSAPTISGDLLAMLSEEKIQVYKLAADKAELLWKKPEKSLHGFCNVTGCKDYLYAWVGGHVGSPTLRCLELKTGKETWAQIVKGECPMNTPACADGKLINVISHCHIPKDPSRGVEMLRTTPEKYTLLGSFDPKPCPWTCPAIAGGKLYLRLDDCMACYDLAQHGPYVNSIAVTKDGITFSCAQADGGLSIKGSADGAIQGLEIHDASGASGRARIEGTSLTVDLKGMAFPLKISYSAEGSIVAHNEPAAAFDWQSPCLRLYQCAGNEIALALDRSADSDVWKAEKTYAVSGAKITKAEIDKTDGRVVRLTTGKSWKQGDKVTIRYPALPGELPGATAELAFTIPPPAAARFVKLEEETSGNWTRGNWKRTYGADGFVIVGDKTNLPKYATVVPTGKIDRIFDDHSKDPRALEKFAADAKDRVAAGWCGDSFDVTIRFTDGAEHQVAIYCPFWGVMSGMIAEVRDADTDACLDAQSAKAYHFCYLVWNVKGNVRVHFSTTNPNRSSTAVVSGIFFDPVQEGK